jgi:hypothetical protein
MKKCMKAVFDLDVIIANVLRDEKVIRTLWKSARHVQRARRKKAGSDTTDVAEESSNTTGSGQQAQAAKGNV